MRKTLLLIPLLALLGCDNVLDCAIMNRRAEMHDKKTQTVRRNEFVEIIYAAEVTNDTADDEDYTYTFQILGELPQGLEAVLHARQVKVTGYPVVAGSSDFRIRVLVDYIGPDDKCLNKTTDEASYRIIVQ